MKKKQRNKNTSEKSIILNQAIDELRYDYETFLWIAIFDFQDLSLKVFSGLQYWIMIGLKSNDLNDYLRLNCIQGFQS